MKKTDFFIIFVVILFVILVFVFFTPVIAEQNRLQEEIGQLNQENESIKYELTLLQKEIADLQNGNPKAVSRVAREKFNYCREGEEIYQLEYIPVEKEP